MSRMVHVRSLPSAISPLYEVSSPFRKRRPKAHPSHPAQSETLFPAIDKGCAAVPDVTLVFLYGWRIKGSRHRLTVDFNLAITNYGSEFACSTSVPEQYFATGTAQPEAIEGLISICSVFRFILWNLKLPISKQGKMPWPGIWVRDL